MHGRALPDGAAFLRLRGSGGYALCKRKRLSFREWKDGRLTACVYTQAVLAILVQAAINNKRNIYLFLYLNGVKRGCKGIYS